MDSNVRELWWERNVAGWEDLHIIDSDNHHVVYENAKMVSRRVDYMDEVYVQVTAIAKADCVHNEEDETESLNQ